MIQISLHSTPHGLKITDSGGACTILTSNDISVIKTLICADKKVHAIRMVRERMLGSLLDAKAVVDFVHDIARINRPLYTASADAWQFATVTGS